jgi:hypothetical protein
VVARALLSAVLALILTGCGMSLPADEQTWAETSLQAVEDMAGNVATSRVALEQEQQDRFLGRAALVLTQDAEDAGGSVVRSYTGTQPPPSRTADFRDLAALLGEAGTALTDVRVAVAAGRAADYPALEARLTEVGGRLEAAAEPLREAAP